MLVIQKVSDKTKKKLKFPTCFVSKGQHAFGTAPRSKRKTLRNGQSMWPNKNFALRVYRAITVFVIVATPEMVPSQIVKALKT